jgi:hypothetical protein
MQETLLAGDRNLAEDICARLATDAARWGDIVRRDVGHRGGGLLRGRRLSGIARARRIARGFRETNKNNAFRSSSRLPPRRKKMKIC